MTTNPLWEEITRELMPGQKAGDRPDLVSRVFNLKLAKLLNEVTKKMCFGVVIAHVHVIEWQKRGLPHVHMLIWLRDDCKIRTTDDIDTVVSAQIPDPQVSICPVVGVDIQLQTHPRLYAIVKRCMVHGPCGPAYPHLHPACITPDKPKCKAYYPFDFCETTTKGSRAYPLYRRPNNGRTLAVGHGASRAIVDNRFIVPYSPHLSVLLNCHLNVECTTGLGSVKYIFKLVLVLQMR
jgi:hypothetical protein